MNERRNSLIVATLVVLLSAIAVTGSGIFSRYAAKVSAQMLFNGMKSPVTSLKNVLPIRHGSIIGGASSKEGTLFLVNLDLQNANVFYTVLVNKKGEIVKRTILKKSGISPFFMYLGTTAMDLSTGVLERTQNPLIAPLVARMSALEREVADEIDRERTPANE